MFVAHVAEDGREEPVREHLLAVGDMAAEFAAEFDSAECARLVGVVHDIGKYSDGFQRRILNDGPRVDHSTAGALLLRNMRLNGLGWLLPYCVAGHHAGLPDGGSRSDNEELSTLQARLKKGGKADRACYDRACEEGVTLSCPEVPPILRHEHPSGFTCSFWARMLFSCLVDADFLCTEAFMKGAPRRGGEGRPLCELQEAFEESIASFYPPKGRLNEMRCGLLDAAKEAASGAPGFYSLTVPTGGGKTLASMRFALHHASRNPRIRRVIYAIPYTSIIEQNAQEFRSRLGAESVLEHHAGFDFDAPEDGDSALQGVKVREGLRLATENWDAPVVVTTNVQLFDSLFASKASKCRKLHNIANSVIVLDEVQALPIEWLRACVSALGELVGHYGCTVVLCTATQPALSRVAHGLGEVREICPNVSQMFSELSRVRYRYAGTLDDEQIIDRLGSHEQALCIVDSRAQARNLFEAARSRGIEALHLSTLMHTEHRARVIEEVRERLRSGRECRVISTSLIEAGVDLDFPVVYRSMNGIDSIVQAAGRCNREGKRPVEESLVYVFEGEGYVVPNEVRQRAGFARSVLGPAGFFDSSGGDEEALGDPRLVEEYFEKLFDMRQNEMDKKEVCRRLEGCALSTIPFRAVGEDFRLIDDATYSVVVPSEKIEGDLQRLREGHGGREAMRKVSRRSVGVYERARDSLLESGVISPLSEDVYELCRPERYTEEWGLSVEGAYGEGIML